MQKVSGRTEEKDIAMRYMAIKKRVLSGGAISIFCLCLHLKCAAHEDAAQTYVAPAIVNLNFCRPSYPRAALLRSEQGMVKLEFTIGIRGKLLGSRVVKSSGFRELDTAALIALMHCSFQPAYRNGLPVQASFTIDYTWSFNRVEEP